MRQGEEMKKNRIVVNGFAFTDRETAQKAVKEAESIKYIKEKLDMENPRMVLEMYRKLTKEQVFRTPVGLVFLKQLQDYLARKPEFKMENLEPIRAVSLPKPQPPSTAGRQAPAQPGNPGNMAAGNPSESGRQAPAQPGSPGNMAAGGTLAGSRQPGNPAGAVPPAGAAGASHLGRGQQGASDEFGSEELAEWYEGQIEEEKQKRRAAELKQRRAEGRLKGRRGMLRFSIAVNIFLLIVAIGMAVITLMDNQPNIINYENKIVDKYAEWEQGLKEREETIKQREQELGL